MPNLFDSYRDCKKNVLLILYMELKCKGSRNDDAQIAAKLNHNSTIEHRRSDCIEDTFKMLMQVILLEFFVVKV
jgi:hypothetical protein